MEKVLFKIFETVRKRTERVDESPKEED